jgi:hypothetical protein
MAELTWDMNRRPCEFTAPERSRVGHGAYRSCRLVKHAVPPFCSLIKVGWLSVKGSPKDRLVAVAPAGQD